MNRAIRNFARILPTSLGWLLVGRPRGRDIMKGAPIDRIGSPVLFCLRNIGPSRSPLVLGRSAPLRSFRV